MRCAHTSLITLLILFGISPCHTEVSCRNEDGKPVDWFVLYKLPKYKLHAVGSGLEYMYLDSSVENWKLSQFLVNTSQGALGSTLKPLYSERSNRSAYVLYNDAPPLLNYSKWYGHTKGALHFDQSQGFWLIHTIPHFPPFPERGYSWPSTGKTYGQTVFCVTYKYGQFHEIAQQLLYYNPNIYNCSLPAVFQKDMPSLALLCDGSKLPPVSKRLKVLISAKGEKFLSFAKSAFYIDGVNRGVFNRPKEGLDIPYFCVVPSESTKRELQKSVIVSPKGICKDIYAGWVAQTLKTDLLAETWQHSIHELPSNCSLPNHVMNIKRIKLPRSIQFKSTFDHSKWCVSRVYEDAWTCLGDLNRARYQIYRSGGLVCSQNPIIYQAFRQAIAWYIGC